MTIPEIQRECEAKRKVYEREMRERATLTYIQPQLYGIILSNMFSKEKTDYPKIYEVFPNLFEEEREEDKRQKEVEASMARFLQFASNHNKNRRLNNG